MQNNNVIVRDILKKFKFHEEASDTGKIISVKDGVARVNGLFGVLSGEMVQLGISKLQGNDGAFEVKLGNVVLTLTLMLEFLFTAIVPRGSPIFSALFGGILLLMLVLAYTDKLEVLLKLTTTRKLMFLGVFWMVHDYDLVTRILGILVIVLILKQIAVRAKLALVCSNTKSEREAVFDTNS